MPRSQKTRLADQLGMHFFLECEGSVSWSILVWSWGWGSRSMDVLTPAQGCPLEVPSLPRAQKSRVVSSWNVRVQRPGATWVGAVGVRVAVGSVPGMPWKSLGGAQAVHFFHIFSRSPLGPTLPSGPQGPWGSRPLGPMGPGPHGPLRCRGLACVSSCNVRVQRPGAFWVGPGGMGAGQQMF